MSQPPGVLYSQEGRILRLTSSTNRHMAKPRHLRNAPITEALFDIRVKMRSGFDLGHFSHLKAALADRFPKVEERRGGQFTLRFPPDPDSPPAFQELGLQGYFFKNASEDVIVQFRGDGFTLNKLKPYSSWDELLPAALDLWGLYQATSSPEAVTRLALRYINHIALPYERVDFDQFFTAAPQVPPELPQLLRGFLYRVTIVNPEAELAAHVVQALEPAVPQPGVTVILDIDSFRDVDLLPSDRQIEDHFKELHEFKNMVFFSYLTEETIRLFE